MLERIKLILNVKEQDELLYELISISTEKLLTYLGEKELPQQFEWIVVELAIQRFNRIGSEGMSSESVDGGFNTYVGDELEPFYTILDRYKDEKNGNTHVKGYKLL